jgi:hypothetical protein
LRALSVVVRSFLEPLGSALVVVLLMSTPLTTRGLLMRFRGMLPLWGIPILFVMSPIARTIVTLLVLSTILSARTIAGLEAAPAITSVSPRIIVKAAAATSRRVRATVVIWHTVKQMKNEKRGVEMTVRKELDEIKAWTKKRRKRKCEIANDKVKHGITIYVRWDEQEGEQKSDGGE